MTSKKPYIGAKYLSAFVGHESKIKVWTGRKECTDKIGMHRFRTQERKVCYRKNTSGTKRYTRKKKRRAEKIDRHTGDPKIK